MKCIDFHRYPDWSQQWQGWFKVSHNQSEIYVQNAIKIGQNCKIHFENPWFCWLSIIVCHYRRIYKDESTKKEKKSMFCVIAYGNFSFRVSGISGRRQHCSNAILVAWWLAWEKKQSRQPEFRMHYSNFMDEYLELDHMAKVCEKTTMSNKKQ